MTRSRIFLAGLASILAGCESPSTSTSNQNADALHRTISASLRSSCGDLAIGGSTAGRKLDTAVPVVVKSNPEYRLQLSIYDSTGSFLVRNESVAASNLENVRIAWDGRDGSGTPVGTGHYFAFERFLDSTGAVVRVDSVCLGYVRASTR